MFKYDKLVKKLSNFDELKAKKQTKVFDTIYSDEFKAWLYQVGENATDQPYTEEMKNRIFGLIAAPYQMKRLTKYIAAKGYDDFDKTTCHLTFNAIDAGLKVLNDVTASVNSDYKNGEIEKRDAKDYKEKSEKYSSYIGDLVNMVKEKASPQVKNLAKKTNMPKGLIYATYFDAPSRKYIPKRHLVGHYMKSILNDIYEWVGNNGFRDKDLAKWDVLFESYFTNDCTASVALSILLEGVTEIDKYRNKEHFDDVRAVWDSLTNYALTELNNSPDHVCKHMVDLYVKKNGNTGSNRQRVNLLMLPRELTTLNRAVNAYRNQLEKMSGASKDMGAIIRSSDPDTNVSKVIEGSRLVESFNKREEDKVSSIDTMKEFIDDEEDDDDDEPVPPSFGDEDE